MSALQIEFPITPERLEIAEACLFDLGCQAISLISDAEEPVLEPAPGETPLWTSVNLRAWFPLEADFAALRRGLLDTLPDVEVSAEFVGNQDWAATNNHAVDQLYAQRLWLRPKQYRGSTLPAGVRAIYLEPGLAFGSGSHPTTNLCLQWLAENLQAADQSERVRVLDFGCGSGILAVSAALLGARVTAVDYDPQAVMATEENAAYNDVLESCEVLSLDQWQARSAQYQGAFDVVIANILAQPLIELAGAFEAVTAPGASIVLSGILRDQAGDVAEAYAKTVFAEPNYQEEWVRLDGKR